MTSAIFSRGTSRRPVRTAACAAALAGALALTGCSDDGGSDDGGASAAPSTTSTADTGGAGGASPEAAGELEGSWLATADGKAVALIITGKQAALFATGGTVCSGTAGQETGMQMIRLTCTTGSKDRTVGMVDSAGADALEVTWEGAAGKETYTKAEGGQWPSGLPTAGLG